jgi:hypothetical protein
LCGVVHCDCGAKGVPEDDDLLEHRTSKSVTIRSPRRTKHLRFTYFSLRAVATNCLQMCDEIAQVGDMATSTESCLSCT